jgi:hypothetical protein
MRVDARGGEENQMDRPAGNVDRNPGTPVYMGPILGGRPNGASRSNEPTYKEPTDDDIFLVRLWSWRLGLPNGLMYWELAVWFAKELENLEALKKKKPGRPRTLGTGARAIKLAAEIQALMEAPGARKEKVIKWLHGQKPYQRTQFRGTMHLT